MTMAASRKAIVHGSRGYHLLVIGVVLLPLVAIPAVESALPLAVRITAALLWLLALAPSLWYVALPPFRRPPIPFIQIVGCLYGLYFALPLVLGAAGLSPLTSLDPSDYPAALELALLGWVLLMGGYGIARIPTPAPMWSRKWNWKPRVFRAVGFSLGFLGVAFDILRYEVVTHSAVGGTLHFLASLTWLGIGILTALFVRGELGRGATLGLLVVTLLSAGVQAATGLVGNLVILGFIFFFAAWSVKKELTLRWLALGLVLLVTVIMFRGVIGEFRALAWVSKPDMPLVERSTLAGRLLVDRILNAGVAGSVGWGAEATARRSAHLDLFADVVRRTPERVPYWAGETYLSLVGMAVPRFLWPEKPTKELGQEFGHRYGYLAPDDDRTSINLPYVVEFYANYGASGVVFGMLLVGFAYGALAGLLNRPGQPLLLSLAVLVFVLPLFNIESDFSMIFGGLLLHGLGLGIVLWLVLEISSTDLRRT